MESISKFMSSVQNPPVLNADLEPYRSQHQEERASQVIDGLVEKIDSLQELSEDLRGALEAKDREILRLRSIAALGKPGAPKRKPGLDAGVQTVLRLREAEVREELTYAQLYE